MRSLILAGTLLTLCFGLASPGLAEATASEPAPLERHPIQGACAPGDVVCRVLEGIRGGMIHLQMVFPEFDLRVALEKAFISLLEANLAGLMDPLRAALARTVFATPQILGGPESPAIEHAWRQVRIVAALFWPVALALTGAAVVSRNALAAGSGDSLGEAVLRWFVVVLASGASIYLCDAVNRVANALTMAFLAIPAQTASDPQAFVNAVVNLLIGGSTGILASLIPGANVAMLLLTLVMALMGFFIILALILQYVARYALIYVLVAIAPLALLGEMFSLTRWFSRMWLRGFILVELLQPISALLFVLLLIMTGSSLTETVNPVGVFVRFMVAAGVLSLLLTINYSVIRLVFGAISEVRERAMGTLGGMARLAVVAGGAILAGSSLAGVASLGSAAETRRLAAGAESLGTGLLQSDSRTLRSLGAGIRVWGRERLADTRREQSARSHEAVPQERPGGRSGFEALENARLNRQDRARFGRQVGGLMGQMSDPRLDAGVQSSIEEALQRVEKAYGGEPFWNAARRVGESIHQYRRRRPGESLTTLAQRQGYFRVDSPGEGDPAAFVAGEVESAIRQRGGTELSTSPPLYSPRADAGHVSPMRTRPAFEDFRQGARVAELLGEGTENIEVYGLLHFAFGRWGTGLSDELIRAAESVHREIAQPAADVDPRGLFVSRVEELLSRPDISQVLPEGSLPVAWRRYVREHAGR